MAGLSYDENIDDLARKARKAYDRHVKANWFHDLEAGLLAAQQFDEALTNLVAAAKDRQGWPK